MQPSRPAFFLEPCEDVLEEAGEHVAEPRLNFLIGPIENEAKQLAVFFDLRVKLIDAGVTYLGLDVPSGETASG